MDSALTHTWSRWIHKREGLGVDVSNGYTPNLMDAVKLRAWWSHRQGLDGSLQGRTSAEVLDRAGWARSVGGVGPYLTLFSRAGLSRAQVDSAIEKLEIHELPSARGCTYVLPASDFALGLKAGEAFGGGEMKVAAKLGVTEKEIAKLRDAVLKALAKGPLDPDGIREAVGKAARSLGPEGVKKGISSTLPLALGDLQTTGEIRRIPITGRLDQQRYRYTLWKPNPLAKYKASAEQAYFELARHYFRWIGPATLAEFQWFSGLGVKAAKAAAEPLRLVPVEGEFLMLPEDRAEFERFKAPKSPQYSLVSSLDSIFLLRRNVSDLVDAADKDRRLGEGKLFGGLTDLPNHAILDRGRIVGLWDYDQPGGSIAWLSFLSPDAALKKAVGEMENYIREQLGDARSFSLDSPKSRAPRIEELRKMAAKAK